MGEVLVTLAFILIFLSPGIMERLAAAERRHLQPIPIESADTEDIELR